MKVEIKNIQTEIRNPNTMDIDVVETIEILRKINNEDKTVAFAVEAELPRIEKLVERIVESFNQNGRLIYLGAGTSGRLGVIDAVECRPTFSVPDEMVQAIIAGGNRAFTSAVEGAEDDKEEAVVGLKEIGLNKNDVVVGIAASGRTPYVIGGLEYAKSVGAATGCVVTVGGSVIEAMVDYPVAAKVGSEALTGSTRLKSGTAQKLILNMLTTASMIKMGKVYSNLMVDVQATNLKLVSRALSIITDITGVSEAEASELMSKFGGVKQAVLAHMANISEVSEVTDLLKETNGHLRNAIKLAGER